MGELMRCEACQGSGERRVISGELVGWRPCPDCGGSGIAHCCDGIQEQRDPGDETPEIALREPRLYRVRGDEPSLCPADCPVRPKWMRDGCADDCCHPSHRHGVDAHNEWREMNDDAA